MKPLQQLHNQLNEEITNLSLIQIAAIDKLLQVAEEQIEQHYDNQAEINKAKAVMYSAAVKLTDTTVKQHETERDFLLKNKEKHVTSN